MSLARFAAPASHLQRRAAQTNPGANPTVKKTRSILAAALATVATAAFAEGLVGTWTLTGEGRDGQPVSSELTVTKTEDGYAGNIVGPQGGQSELNSIEIDGNSFSFVRPIEGPMGEMDLDYSGTVDGDTLTGEVEVMFQSRPITGVRKM